MRYLTLAAAYSGSPLRDDFTGPVAPEELGVPPDLCDQIGQWNERYNPIILLGDSARAEPDQAHLIATLDSEGLSLAEAITSALGDCKVRYFSEGHLRILGWGLRSSQSRPLG